ncbi:hypothetical protein MLD38_040581 [Melastoma candidum]|nr:hypothetical protein MLD38_040581 [Melastoma candidum]
MYKMGVVKIQTAYLPDDDGDDDSGGWGAVWVGHLVDHVCPFTAANPICLLQVCFLVRFSSMKKQMKVGGLVRVHRVLPWIRGPHPKTRFTAGCPVKPTTTTARRTR